MACHSSRCAPPPWAGRANNNRHALERENRFYLVPRQRIVFSPVHPGTAETEVAYFPSSRIGQIVIDDNIERKSYADTGMLRGLHFPVPFNNQNRIFL
jgi:hypothetical protein